MRFACIDIGTVTARLALVVAEAGRVISADKTSVIANLGEGLALSGRLSDSACARVCETVAQFVAEARAWGATQLCCTLTAAARQATNSHELLTELAKLNVVPEVIPGELEGKLTFLGVAQDFDGEPLLVVDSGGGSTELAYGQLTTTNMHLQLQAVSSAPVGARTITDSFLHSDPPTSAELQAGLAACTAAVRTHLPGQFVPGSRVVCVGGTATTLVAIHKQLEPYDSNQVHKASLSAQAVSQLSRKLAALAVSERAQVTGLQAKRAPVIVGGILCLEAVLAVSNAAQLTVSEHDLLWGLATVGALSLSQSGDAQAHELIGWVPTFVSLSR